MQQQTDRQGGEGKGGVAGDQSHLNGKGGMIQTGLKGLAQHRCVRGLCQLPLCLVACTAVSLSSAPSCWLCA